MEFIESVLRLIIWLLFIRFLTNPSSLKYKPIVDGQVRAPKKIKYLVNGREIHVPHCVYYQQVIGIYNKTGIDNVVIRKSAFQKWQELNPNYNENIFNEEMDIKAAKYYLLDNWEHMVMLN